MKRLAIAVVAAAVGLAGAVAADAAPPSRRVCKQNAETSVRTGVDDVAVVEVGTDIRRQAPRVFVCYKATEGFLSDGPFAGVVSVWADPEYGRVGASCAKHKTWDDLGCGHHSYALPARATTPVEHPDGPWGISALGIDIGYAFNSSTASLSVDTGMRCIGDQCVTGPSRSVTARHGVQYRLFGWECTAQGDSACTSSGGRTGATVGEDDPEPTVTDGTVSIDLPAVCVEASTDPIC